METVYFQNNRGERLAGLLCGGAGGRPVVVVCHGFTGSKEGRGKAVEMARFLDQNGWACLLFDFAGCGESQGAPENISLSNHIGDLTSAIDLCQDRGLGPVVTMGRSFGGSTVLCQAAGDPRVKAVCTWAAPAELSDLFLGLTDEDLPEDENSLITLAGSEGMIQLKAGFFSDLLRHDVTGSASRLAPRPLLVVQGTRDEVVEPDQARRIFSAAGNPKKLAMVEGADHQFSAHYAEVWQIVLDWLKNSGIRE